jgi:hypothetical protein
MYNDQAGQQLYSMDQQFKQAYQERGIRSGNRPSIPEMNLKGKNKHLFDIIPDVRELQGKTMRKQNNKMLLR